MIRLRDVPGVQGIEDTERLNRGANVSNDPDLSRRVEEVAKRAFGLAPGDTGFQYPDFALEKPWEDLSEDEENQVYAAWDEWHSHFRLSDQGDEKATWAGLGWDVTDLNGDVLICLPRFKDLMICVSKGLRGRPVEELATEAWATRLRPTKPSPPTAEQQARNQAFLSLGARGRKRAS